MYRVPGIVRWSLLMDVVLRQTNGKNTNAKLLRENAMYSISYSTTTRRRLTIDTTCSLQKVHLTPNTYSRISIVPHEGFYSIRYSTHVLKNNGVVGCCIYSTGI